MEESSLLPATMASKHGARVQAAVRTIGPDMPQLLGGEPGAGECVNKADPRCSPPCPCSQLHLVTLE